MIKITRLVENNEVRIKTHIVKGRRYNGIYVNSEMTNYVGKKTTITKKTNNPYGPGICFRLKIDKSCWTWHESMIERLN